MDLELTGRTFVITGAARGIGATTARVAAREGANIVIADVLDEPGEALAKELGATYVHCDVTAPDQIEALMATAADTYGGIDVLHNNAGIFLGNGNGDGDLETMDFAVWQRTLSVNLSGPFLCTKYALPLMLPTGAGSIINTASVSGAFIGSTAVAYASSKAGLVGLTRATVLTYASRGIRANAICPGTFATEMSATVRADPALTQRLIGTIPAGRIGEPADFGQLAAFLASPASSYLNGAIIPLEGGRTMY